MLVDVAAGLVVMLLALMGFRRGLVGELLILLSWLAATAASYNAFPWVQSVLRPVVTPDYLADGLAVAVPFLVVLVALQTLAHRLADGARNSGLGAADRLTGLAFGAVRAVYVVGLTLILISRALPGQNQPEWLRESQALALAHHYGVDSLKALIGAAAVNEVTDKFDAAVAKARRASSRGHGQD
jgi:membrane protein required for colicin V production